MADEVSLGPFITNLRAALSGVEESTLRDAFDQYDTNGTGDLDPSELRLVLKSLGFNVSARELDNIVDFFDTDHSGTVSFEEMRTFARSESSENIDELGLMMNRLRGALLGFGDDSLMKMFINPSKAKSLGSNKPSPSDLIELSAEEFLDAMHSLGLKDTRLREAKGLLLRMDSSNDGYVSYDELESFLGQKRFTEGVRLVLEKSARFLRSRGTSLQRALMKKEEGDDGPIDGTVTTATLKRVLVDRLKFPLDNAQLDAICQMADLDGNGECDIEEVLYLAGETFDPEDLDAEETHTDDVQGVNALGATAFEDLDLITCDSVCSFQEPDEQEDKRSSPSVEAKKAEDSTASTSTFDRIALIAQEVGDSYFGLTSSSSSSSPIVSSVQLTVGNSSLDVLKVPLFYKGLQHSPALEDWSNIVNAAFDALSSETKLSPTTVKSSKTEDATHVPVSEATLTQPRCCQALALLGLYISSIQLSALLRKLIDPAKAAAAAVLSGGALQPVNKATFRSLVNEIRVHHNIESTNNEGLNNLSPIASARIIDTLSRRAFASGSTGATQSELILSRPALAVALLSVPGARLTEAECVAVAAYAPGMHSDRCIKSVHDIVKERLNKKETSSTAHISIFDVYPSEATASLSVRTGLPPGEADVSLSQFCSWLGHLSTSGASCGKISPLQNQKTTKTNANGGSSDGKTEEEMQSEVEVLEEIFDPAVNSMFGSLDPVARSGIRKLCSGAICCPVVDALTTTRTGAFAAFAKRLPASFRPSVLGSLSAAGHSFLSIGAHLFDGGFDADPGKQGVSALLSQGLGTDGLGLTLRMSSMLLQAPFEVEVGCLPTGGGGAGGGIFSSSNSTLGKESQYEIPGALLRPVGAHSGISDTKEINNSLAGDVVKSPSELKTAVVTIKSCSGIPVPSDADIRGAIVNRFVRVSLCDFIVGRSNLGTASLECRPSMQSHPRILSNATAITAGWNTTQEGTWSIPPLPTDLSKLPQANADYAASTASGIINGSATNKVVLRCAASRKDGRFGVSAPFALFELVMVLSNPQSKSTEGEEEVTCAWGCVPLSTLADGSNESPIGSNISVKLFGGVPGATSDIASSDFAQRRVTGITSAMAVAIAGNVQHPALIIQSTPLSKLTSSQRFPLSRLPFSVVVPLVWAPVISALRQMIAEDLAVVLARQQTDGRSVPAFSSKRAPSTLLLGSGSGAAVATAISLLSLRGSAGVNTSIGVLGKALEVLRHDAKKSTSASSSHKKLHADSAALRNILMRVWACTASSGGLLDVSAPKATMNNTQRSSSSSETQLAWSLFRAPMPLGAPFSQVLADPASQLMPLCGMANPSSGGGVTVWRPLTLNDFHANLGAQANYGF
jgi:Ca2+-binding EF-hand superfamily protein